MPQFDFHSGTEPYDAIVMMLARRQAEQRQTLLDQLNIKNVNSQIEDRKASRDLQEKTLKHATDQQQQVFDYNRAKEITENAGADEKPGDAKDLIKRFFPNRLEEKTTKPTEGYGVLEEAQKPAGTGILQDQPKVPAMVPGIVDSYVRPGAKYEMARTAAEERAALEKDKAAERTSTEKQRQLDREAMQNDRQQFQEGQNKLSRQIQQQNADTATTRVTDKEAADKAKDNELKAKDESAREDSYRWASGTLAELGNLIDDKGNLTAGAHGIAGATMGTRWLPGSQAATAEASLGRVKSRLAIDLMRQMKAQSRTGATGFGQLSDRELNVLENAAGRFSTWQSDKDFADALKEVSEAIRQVQQKNQPKQATLGNDTTVGKSVGYFDAQGNYHRSEKK